MLGGLRSVGASWAYRVFRVEGLGAIGCRTPLYPKPYPLERLHCQDLVKELTRCAVKLNDLTCSGILDTVTLNLGTAPPSNNLY